MTKHGTLRAAVGAAAFVAAAAALGLALIESAPSRPSVRDVAERSGGLPVRGPARPQTIVMVVFDELPLTSLIGRGGLIDAERYPAFAGLARDATWYRGATAVHDSTALAVPAILDGRYPRTGMDSDVYSHPANLFTLLEHRYQVNASEEATGLCPTSLCEPEAGTTASHLSSGKPERFRRFVSSIRPDSRPTLWFKHLLLPHVPWQFYPSGRRYRRYAPEPVPGLNGELGFGVPWLVKLSYQRHLLQVGFADRLLGELLGRLKRVALYDDAMIVVVADHGIGFHVGVERRTVTPRNVQDLAPVPLLVKLPGQIRGEIVDRHIETIDVLPTILEVAGTPEPSRLDGRSLLEPVASQARRVRVFHRVGTELNTIGGDYVFTVDALDRRTKAAVRRKLALFGSGGAREPSALFRIGPHAELVGRRIANIAQVPGVGSAQIHQEAELRQVEPASGFVPGQITGQVAYGRPGGGRAMAVAMNGRVAATGRTFSLAGSSAETFEVIVPERAFHRGANEARVYEIVTLGGRPALRPL